MATSSLLAKLQKRVAEAKLLSQQTISELDSLPELQADERDLALAALFIMRRHPESYVNYMREGQLIMQYFAGSFPKSEYFSRFIGPDKESQRLLRMLKLEYHVQQFSFISGISQVELSAAFIRAAKLIIQQHTKVENT